MTCGFALNFYASKGNYDLVGNNTPVLFIRDTIKDGPMRYSVTTDPVYSPNSVGGPRSNDIGPASQATFPTALCGRCSTGRWSTGATWTRRPATRSPMPSASEIVSR